MVGWLVWVLGHVNPLVFYAEYRQFFQAVAVSVLLYGCTTWTLTKRLENKIDGSCTRMLRAALNKSWKQHPTKKQLYGHLPPITQTIRERRTRHAGHCWEKKWTNKRRALVGPNTRTHQTRAADKDLHRAAQRGFSITTRRTCRGRWRIGRSGGRESWRSVLPARPDDDDDVFIYKLNFFLWTQFFLQTKFLWTHVNFFFVVITNSFLSSL